MISIDHIIPSRKDTMTEFTLRRVEEKDRDWIRDFATLQWGSDFMVVHGITYHVSQHAGWIAEINGERVGLGTYQVTAELCEITSLGSLHEGIGIGTALIDAITGSAREAGCKRIFLITTNDNTRALRFYQRRGFHLVALYRDAVTESRKIKPEIPLIGDDGIPLRDEIELEKGIIQS
jgi:DNA-3-methyladenine glycosylase I